MFYTTSPIGKQNNRTRGLTCSPLAALPFLLLSSMMLLVAMTSPAAHGQQEFTLSEEDAWLAERAIDPATPEGQLAEIRRLLAAGDASRAEILASQWIEEHPRHPLMPQAYLLRGDALLAQGEEYKALFDYEYLARMYPGSDVFVTALQRELDIAKAYAAGLRRKLWGFRFVSAEDEAEELFIRIQERLPGSRLAEEAGMELADFYFTRRRMQLAAEAYTLFIENYPRSQQLNKARRRQIYAYLAEFKGPEFDARGLYEARERLRDLRVKRPAEAEQLGADALLTRIDESDAMKMLETARWYLRVNDPIAAELTIRRLVTKYARSVAAAEALRMIPDIMPRLPERIRQQAPDYDAMRAGLLGLAVPADETHADAADGSHHVDHTASAGTSQSQTQAAQESLQ